MKLLFSRYPLRLNTNARTQPLSLTTTLCPSSEMKTRASIKREAQENPDETHLVGAQSQTTNEPPQKRTRRKGPSQPVRGGWDELPHNLGRVDLNPKEKAVQSGKVRHIVLN